MKPKIDPDELKQLLSQGKTNTEIAQHFHSSERQIRFWKLKLRQMENPPVPTISCNISIVRQLAELRRKIRSILEESTKPVSMTCPHCNNAIDSVSHNPETAIKASREIRGQMRMELDLAKAWVEIQAIQDWQKEVIEVIRRHCARDQWVAMIRDLQAMRTARSAIAYQGSEPIK